MPGCLLEERCCDREIAGLPLLDPTNSGATILYSPSSPSVRRGADLSLIWNGACQVQGATRGVGGGRSPAGRVGALRQLRLLLRGIETRSPGSGPSHAAGNR